MTRPRRLALGLAVALALAAVAVRYLAFPRPPPDAPRIGVSLDRFPLNELGITGAAFEAALATAGGRMIELSPEQDPALVDALLDELDALVIGGGGDVDPGLESEDDRLQRALLEGAVARQLPVLGVCRGLQLLNVARGGSLAELDDAASARHFLTSHPIHVDPDSRLGELLGTTRPPDVMSTHRYGLGGLGEGLRAVAWADAAHAEIEAVEASGPTWLVGVMWHPEREALTSDEHSLLLRALVAEAAAVRTRAPGLPTDCPDPANQLPPP